MAGAGAVLALIHAVVTCTVHTMYNHEQVKLLEKRVRSITPLVEVCGRFVLPCLGYGKWSLF